nr:uncharacterized protein LOC109399987 [Aedes albopictus]
MPPKSDPEANPVFLRGTKVNLLESFERLKKIFDDGGDKLINSIDAWSERIEQIAQDYRRVVCELESVHGDAPYKTERLDFEESYCEMRAIALKIQKGGSTPPPPQTPRTVTNIRYPELSLPRFSGRLEDWCVFRDAFDSAIGCRAEISDYEKFQYLKGLVQGDASRIVNSVPVSQDGYRDAWRALKLRYENKRQLVRCHIQALFDTPAMRRESAEELLNLVDRFEQHLSVLKRLGEDTLAWSSLLVFQLSIRLHPNTLREWENNCVRLDSNNVAAILGGTAESDDEDEEDLPSYVSMVNYLQNYARVLQSVGPFRDRDVKSKPVRSAVHVSSPPVSSSFKSTRNCVKCHQDHFLYQCPDFNKLSENQRLDFAKNLKLCLNCLRKVDHFAKACPWKTCNRCSKKHHTLLHGANFALPTSPGSPPSRPVAMVAQPSSPPQAPKAPSLQDSRSSSSSTLSAQSQPPFAYTDLNVAMMTCDTVKIPNTVILPTALVEIEGNKGSKVLARCLLDSGSQSNFMTSALCLELHLSRTNAPSPVVISGIGQATIKSNQMVSAKLSSLTSAFSVEPQFLVLPSLAVKLPVSTISIQEWPIPPHRACKRSVRRGNRVWEAQV